MKRHTPPHKLRHLGIERRHQLVRHFDDRDVKPTMDQVLRHLQPNEAAANHNRPPRTLRFDPLPDFPAIGDRAQGEDPRQVNTR